MTQKEIEKEIEANLRRIAELDRKAELAALRGNVEALEMILAEYPKLPKPSWGGRGTLS